MEESISHLVLKREIDKLALITQEDACRTENDFEKLVVRWNKIDENRERRERRYEIGRPEKIMELGYSDGNLIPHPTNQPWWKQMLKGEFLDVIFDCPLEIEELTDHYPLCELIEKLKDGQKEIFYYWVIKQWKPQKIALFREQTDRNILKVYATMIESLRYKLYMRLMIYYRFKMPLTIEEKVFISDNLKKYGKGKPPRKRKKKTPLNDDKS